MMPVELPHCFHRRALLLPQALPHLRPERGPIVGADVRFETRCQQRADRCKHRLAAVHTYCALQRGPSSRLWRKRQRGWGRWCLHLHGHGRLGLSGRRQRHQRAQSKQLYLSLKFFHAFCRSPHSGQSLFLSPPVAVLRTEAHIWERSCPLTILRHLANLQAPNALRQGIPVLLCEPSAASASLRYPCSYDASLILDRDNTCACPGHL
jgi:hypothetical protein